MFALKQKSYFVELHNETSKLPVSSFSEEGFDTLPSHHGPSTGCKSNLEFFWIPIFLLGKLSVAVSELSYIVSAFNGRKQRRIKLE